jgi:hypothetical protein
MQFPEDERIAAVAAGGFLSAMLSERGVLYMCGDNDCGQCGIAEDRGHGIRLPRRVSAPTAVLQVRCAFHLHILLTRAPHLPSSPTPDAPLRLPFPSLGAFPSPSRTVPPLPEPSLPFPNCPVTPTEQRGGAAASGTLKRIVEIAWRQTTFFTFYSLFFTTIRFTLPASILALQVERTESLATWRVTTKSPMKLGSITRGLS